ncbi:MAG TPA: S1/P1 nuclease, partial [Bryobacteraceae bacterium]|nr:S1/P1 nuclease [Bryobacteraceae bacterium]
MNRLIFACSLLFASGSPAFAWGCEGHKTVALIAQKYLNSKARNTVVTLLKKFPYTPNPNFDCEPRSVAIADAALWADDIRNTRRETAPWHYQDIPITESGENPSKFCPEKGCVTRAIREQLAKLKASGELTEERVEALRYVIHFVGDMHQPLHTSTNDDAGGNCVPIGFFERRTAPNNPEKRSYSPNLHSVWDTELLRRFMQPYSTASAMAERVDLAYRGGRKILQQGTLDDWLREGHKAAIDAVYGKLLPTPEQTRALLTEIRGDSDGEGCGAVLERNAAKNLTVDDRYQQGAEPVILEQLAKAGY